MIEPSNSPERENEGQALFQKGLSLEADGKTAEAIDFYRRAVETCPDIAQAHFNLGVNLAMLGRNEEAIRSWKRAVWLKRDFINDLVTALDLDHEMREMEIFPEGTLLS